MSQGKAFMRTSQSKSIVVCHVWHGRRKVVCKAMFCGAKGQGCPSLVTKTGLFTTMVFGPSVPLILRAETRFIRMDASCSLQMRNTLHGFPWTNFRDLAVSIVAGVFDSLQLCPFLVPWHSRDVPCAFRVAKKNSSQSRQAIRHGCVFSRPPC